jgi:hypothetical protein
MQRNVSEIRPVYGLPSTDAAEEQEQGSRRGALPVPLLLLVVGLAVAAIWFVARPAVDGSPPAAPPCQKVVVAESGAGRCADKPAPATPEG